MRVGAARIGLDPMATGASEVALGPPKTMRPSDVPIRVWPSLHRFSGPSAAAGTLANAWSPGFLKAIGTPRPELEEAVDEMMQAIREHRSRSEAPEL